jgi:hypothetical protein
MRKYLLLTALVVAVPVNLAVILLLTHFPSFWRDPHDVAVLCLMPCIGVAMWFGSSVGIVTSMAVGLFAVCYVYPPVLSPWIDDPIHVAELGFVTLLAVCGCKAVEALGDLHQEIWSDHG